MRDKEQLPELHAKLDEADIPALANELEVGEPTLRDIFDALARPDRDPREDLPKPIFKKGVLKLEDLQPGMELKGTVLNVVDFGAFVDIGLKDSGLVHISQLANRYIKSPHDVVSVGDVVTVWVMGVDQERKRVSLTMVKPGTERPAAGRKAAVAAVAAARSRANGRRRRRARQGAGARGASPASRRLARCPRNPPARSPAAAPEGGGRGAPEAPGASAGRSGQRSGRRPGGGRRPAVRGGGSRAAAARRPGGHGAGGPGTDRTGRPRPRQAVQARPPPPPLSKDALTGNVPLRSFGQLKQLWQARVEGEPAPEAPKNKEAEASPPSTEPTPPPPATPEAPKPEGTANEGATTPNVGRARSGPVPASGMRLIASPGAVSTRRSSHRRCDPTAVSTRGVGPPGKAISYGLQEFRAPGLLIGNGKFQRFMADLE